MMKRLIWIIPLTFVMAGCPWPSNGNVATVKPESTTEAPVTADHIESLSQQITQVQTTISTQTTNYQRDAEQAKTDRRIFGCLIGIVAAFGITGFCTKLSFTGIYRMIALGVVALLVVGSVFMLMW